MTVNQSVIDRENQAEIARINTWIEKIRNRVRKDVERGEVKKLCCYVGSAYREMIESVEYDCTCDELV